MILVMSLRINNCLGHISALVARGVGGSGLTEAALLVIQDTHSVKLNNPQRVKQNILTGTKKESLERQVNEHRHIQRVDLHSTLRRSCWF